MTDPIVTDTVSLLNPGPAQDMGFGRNGFDCIDVTVLERIDLEDDIVEHDLLTLHQG